MAMGKIEDNVEILKEAAHMNKRIIPPNIDKLLQQVNKPTSCYANFCKKDIWYSYFPGFQGLNESTGDRATILDLFRYPRLRKISLVNFVIWFAVYFMYYGLMMNLSNMGGDIYLNTVISGEMSHIIPNQWHASDFSCLYRRCGNTRFVTVGCDTVKARSAVATHGDHLHERYFLPAHATVGWVRPMIEEEEEWEVSLEMHERLTEAKRGTRKSPNY